MDHEKLKAAFLQGGEREATELFNELLVIETCENERRPHFGLRLTSVWG